MPSRCDVPTLAPGQASAPSIWCPGWLGQLSVFPARLLSRLVDEARVLLLRRPHPSVPPRRAWIFCPRGQPVGTLLRNIHGACAPVSHIALRGHNCPVVTGRDYLDLKPGEVLDLPVVTQPRRRSRTLCQAVPLPEPPLLLGAGPCHHPVPTQA